MNAFDDDPLCTECSALADTDELCAHRNPVCLSCCADNHHWQTEHGDDQ